VRAQLLVAHDDDEAAASPHVPHTEVLLCEQYVLAHWPPNAQAPPAARGPVAIHAAGGLLSRKSAQEYVANAVTQLSTSDGELPVDGAASPIVHESVSLVTHVFISPYVRVMPVPFVQVWRLLHRACARSAQACATDGPDEPHPLIPRHKRRQVATKLSVIEERMTGDVRTRVAIHAKKLAPLVFDIADHFES
jgi:hypothetical protein